MDKKHKLNVKTPQIISLIVLSAFAAMGAVLMTPALPTIAQYFHISQKDSQLIVTVFLLGYAFGQLIYGPIANRHGRKVALYVGIVIATIGSIFSILAKPADSYQLLLIGRFIEAVGCSAGLVISFTIINDFYFPKQARTQMAMLTLAFAIVPGLATVIGGYITQYLDWQSCFYFLLIYGFILLYPAITLPETIIKRDPHAMRSRYLFKNYIAQLSNRNLVSYAIMFGLSTGCAYTFSAEGPFIGIHFFGLSTSDYGTIGFIPFIGALIGSIINARIAEQVSATMMTKIGFGFELAAALVMIFCCALHIYSIWAFLLPLILFFFGHATLSSNYSILGSNTTEDKANGSAMMMFLNMGTAMLVTFFFSLGPTASLYSLPTAMIIALVIILAIAVFNFRLFRKY
jgi:MFS family permease